MRRKQGPTPGETIVVLFIFLWHYKDILQRTRGTPAQEQLIDIGQEGLRESFGDKFLDDSM
jgi:hypothetical protein